MTVNSSSTFIFCSSLQNATDINRKCDSYFIKKLLQIFIAKCVRFLINKCANSIRKCDIYYKVRRFYYKMRYLIRNGGLLSKDSFFNLKRFWKTSENSLENNYNGVLSWWCHYLILRPRPCNFLNIKGFCHVRFPGNFVKCFRIVSMLDCLSESGQ